MQLHAAIFTVKSTVNHVTSAAIVQAGYTNMPGINIIFGQHIKKKDLKSVGFEYFMKYIQYK